MSSNVRKRHSDSQYTQLPVNKNRSLPRVSRFQWFNCTNVLLFLIFGLLLGFGIGAFVGGIKTRPVAMDLMARFVGISNFIQKSDRMLNDDVIQQVTAEAQRVLDMVPEETLQQVISKGAILLNAVSEEDILTTKNNLMSIMDVVGAIDKEKVQAIINGIDMNKLNILLEHTSSIEQRLKDLHEIKISI